MPQEDTLPTKNTPTDEAPTERAMAEQYAAEELAAQALASLPTVPGRPTSIPTAGELRTRMAEALDAETMQRLDARAARRRARSLSPEEIERQIDAAVEADSH